MIFDNDSKPEIPIPIDMEEKIDIVLFAEFIRSFASISFIVNCLDGISDEEFKEKVEKYKEHNPPKFKEALMFREIYSGYFEGCDKLIPYYWLPKWCGDVIEPSARILSVYE